MSRTGLLLTLVTLSACPGRLTSPERFTDATLAFSCDPSIDIAKDVIAPRCSTSGCHNASAPAAGLDLETPGVALRLFGERSSFCPKELLLDPQNPFGGYFFDKMSQDKPSCGSRMPLTGAKITDAEAACLHLWLAEQLEAAADMR
ncbi:MAG: hypothetical protein IT381_07190 [Deltaproteobacteria bacterium]|nr:hypothetical protein [Deltaproteobacteria bacterium]